MKNWLHLGSCLTLVLIGHLLVAADEPDATAKRDPAETPKNTDVKLLPWNSSLATGLREAQLHKRPILIRFGGDHCPWCRRLDLEIDKPAVQKALQRFTLVTLNVEKDSVEARRLTVGPIPALRVVSLTGRLLEWHDGYLTEEQLLEWLDETMEKTNTVPDEILLASDPPPPVAVQKIIRQFGDRAPAVREAAIRRLMPHATESAEAVVNALQQDKLSTRLAAFELLREWQAPLDGLDPWRPETMTDERFQNLKQWLTTISADRSGPPALAGEALAAAREQIDQLLKADVTTAAAIRERLARYKTALLPEVVARLKATANDEEHNVLLALRYRLAMDDGLFLRSPGLVERLASADAKTRHAAVHELSQQAGSESQSLFLELFADADPLVRELSLQGLRAAGAEDATNALVKLLDDPEPNVRAAVLKQLAEEPWSGLKPRLAEFLKAEKDSDLIVQAVRCFRKMKQRPAEILLPLLKHREWQVRAETLDTITGAWQAHVDNIGQQLLQEEEVRDAILACLNDDDAFVTSRAILGLGSNLTKETVQALLSVPDKHPSLMIKVAEVLSGDKQFKALTLPVFKKFFAGKDPSVRAAAITAMTGIAGHQAQEELIASLQDPEQEVRIAGAKSLQKLLDRWQPHLQKNSWKLPSLATVDDDDRSEIESPSIDTSNDLPQPEGNVVGEALSAVARLFFGTTKPREGEPALEVPVPLGEKPESAEDAKKSDESNNEKLQLQLQRDEWLRNFQAGKNGPAWRAALIPSLEKMFASPASKERLASAIPLVALGQGKKVVPTLIDLAKAEEKEAHELLHVLAWLPHPEREALAREFIKQPVLKPLGPQMFSVIANLRDSRDLDFLWSLCDSPELVKGNGYTVQSGLKRIFFGDRYYDRRSLTARQKRQAFESASQQLSAPRSPRQLVALTIMVDYLPDANAEEVMAKIQATARTLSEDASLDDDLRADAFQLTLAMLDQRALKIKLVEMLSAASPNRQLLALHALTTAENRLSTLAHSQLSIERQHYEVADASDGKKIYPAAPEGVTPEIVRPLLASPQAEIRALAGYLLVVSEEPEGMTPLLEYWRKNAKGQDEWDRLVYRAIAAADDSSQVPVLKQIYKRLNKWEVNNFYWTIRIMNGPEILDFRKQIRKEHGGEALQ